MANSARWLYRCVEGGDAELVGLARHDPPRTERCRGTRLPVPHKLPVAANPDGVAENRINARRWCRPRHEQIAARTGINGCVHVGRRGWPLGSREVKRCRRFGVALGRTREHRERVVRRRLQSVEECDGTELRANLAHDISRLCGHDPRGHRQAQRCCPLHEDTVLDRLHRCDRESGGWRRVRRFNCHRARECHCNKRA